MMAVSTGNMKLKLEEYDETLEPWMCPVLHLDAPSKFLGYNETIEGYPAGFISRIVTAEKPFVNVLVTDVVDPSWFYCLVEGLRPEENLLRLAKQMNDYYCHGADEASTIDLAAAVSLDGAAVACPCRPRRMTKHKGVEWCRGLVLHAVSVDEYKVFLVDCGRTQVFHQTQLRKLRRDFANALPCQAIRCAMAGLTSIPSAMSSSVARQLRSRIRAFKCRMIGFPLAPRQEVVHMVLIHLERGSGREDSTLCLNELIIEDEDTGIGRNAMLARWKQAEKEVKKCLAKSRRDLTNAFSGVDGLEFLEL